jgi:adenosylhomocysteine nucleosidase
MWKFLVGKYVQQAAAEKVNEAVAEATEAARARAQAAASDVKGRHRPTSDIGIVFSNSAEEASVVSRLRDTVNIQGGGITAHEGELAGKRVVVVHSGAGQKAAAQATRALIDGHRPQWVVSAGFASGLASDVNRGDVVIADSVANQNDDRLTIDLTIDPLTATAMRGVHLGRLVTLDRLPLNEKDKRATGNRHAALAADSATYAVLDMCRESKVRCLAVRIISDSAADNLPADVAHLLAEKSVAGKLGAATGAIWRRPSSFKDWWKFKEEAGKYSNRLAIFLESMIAQLTHPNQD